MIEMVAVILSWASKRKVKTRFALSRTLKPQGVPLIPRPFSQGRRGGFETENLQGPLCDD